MLERTKLGGHDVPEVDIRRRFPRSLTNFWNLYRPLADYWVLVYNSGDVPENVAIGEGGQTIVKNPESFKLFQDIIDDHD